MIIKGTYIFAANDNMSNPILTVVREGDDGEEHAYVTVNGKAVTLIKDMLDFRRLDDVCGQITDCKKKCPFYAFSGPTEMTCSDAFLLNVDKVDEIAEELEKKDAGKDIS